MGELACGEEGLGKVWSAPLIVAGSFIERVRGFLAPRPPGCVLMIVPCSSIHTFGMGNDLDVAFVGIDGRVLYSERSVRPGRVVRVRHAQAVLERRSSDGGPWYQVGERIMTCIEG